jgi:salicylate hydroxylase
VTLATGQTIHCDLIVGAYGIHSITRQIVVGHPDDATKTGDAAYRAVIPSEAMESDEELKRLIESSEINCWMGPHQHIVAYPVVSFSSEEGRLWDVTFIVARFFPW